MLFGHVVFPQHCAHSPDLVASSKQVLMPCVMKCLHACNIECLVFRTNHKTIHGSVDFALHCLVFPSFLASFIAVLFQQC